MKHNPLALLFLIISAATISNSASAQSQRPTPDANPPIVITSFAPATATTGDTVTIRLMLPIEITGVKFGGEPADIVSNGAFDATVKAVVGNGASGKIILQGTLRADSVDGFTFIPPSEDCKVRLCGPVTNANLTTNLTGISYQWEFSPDGNEYSPITNDDTYGSTQASTLLLSNISFLYNGYMYRCTTDGHHGKVFTLQFQNAWLGGLTYNWEDPMNWSCGVVPDVHTDVVISHGTVTVNQSTVINSLTLAPGVNFTVANGAMLNIIH